MENYFSARHIGCGLVLGPSDYSVILNWTYGSTRNVSAVPFLETDNEFPHPTFSRLGIISATLFAILLTSHRPTFKIKDVVLYQKILYGIFITIFFILTFPFLIIFAIYRCVVFCLLQMGSPFFISLMDGSDAVWNMNDSSQPIITVLAEIEAEEAENLLKSIRDAILKAIIMNPKLSWKRIHSQMGFSYWESCDDLSSLKEHVHWMPKYKQTLEDYITLSELQELISDIAHHGLPGDNSCWEILISSQKLFTGNNDSRASYPVLFRIHHSLGDGMSLLELLLNSLSTNGYYVEQHKYSSNSLKLSTSIKKTGEMFCGSDCFKNDGNLMSLKHEDVDSKLIKHIGTYRKEFQMSRNMRDFSERLKVIDQFNCQRGITEIFVVDRKIRLGPRRIISQSSLKRVHSYLLQNINIVGFIANNLKILYSIIYSVNKIRNTCETSIFDTKNISGKKIIAWCTDTPQGHIFSSIKRIKSQVGGVRFTDVFLTALSGSMEKFLSGRNAYIPECISVVLPVFMKQNTEYTSVPSNTSIYTNKEYHNNRLINLQNSFSVGVLNLPLRNSVKNSRASRLMTIAQCTDYMNKSGQFRLYYFILKWVAYLVPERLLNSLLQKMVHNTMVVSNLVGPTNIVYIAGYPLKNIYFWVPHRGNTGISVSILSYCNRLQLGMMVDKSIIKNADEVQYLLDETVSEITKMMDLCAHQTC